MSAAITAAEKGLYQRLTEDTALAALLGSGRRIYPEWPRDTLTPADLPRLTFYLSGPAPLAEGVQRVRASLDLWVWPTGANGGRTKLLEVDARLVAVLDEQGWTYEEHWIYATAGPFRDSPGAPDQATRRHRDFFLDVAALTPAPAA